MSLLVRHADGGEPLWRVAVAGSWLSRLRGLIGRPSLKPDEGLYLPGSNGVHMMFMRFSIDCLFLGAPRADGARPVIALRANLAPWKGLVPWVRGARGAIEVSAGAVAAMNVREGDYLTLEPAA